jgi:hypothetical protein
MTTDIKNIKYILMDSLLLSVLFFLSFIPFVLIEPEQFPDGFFVLV